jgi:uncharacterized protein YjbI with pentapeptide repeats
MAVKVVRRYPVALLAVFVVLGGTGAAARSLITGADVRDGTLASADFRDGSLKRSDFSSGARLRGPRGQRGPKGVPGPAGPPGPTGGNDLPLAYARVAADGSVEAGSDGVAVHRAAPGVYCVSLAKARWAQVSAADASVIASATLLAGAATRSPCAGDATIRVSVAGSSGVLEDGPFNLLARNG